MSERSLNGSDTLGEDLPFALRDLTLQHDSLYSARVLRFQFRYLGQGRDRLHQVVQSLARQTRYLNRWRLSSQVLDVHLVGSEVRLDPALIERKATGA